MTENINHKGEEDMFGTRWQPLNLAVSDWPRLQGEMERAFERLTGTPVRQLARATFPALNMWEEDEKFLVEAELPGLELDELEIFVSGTNQLTLKGQRKQPELKEGTWHRQERGFGSFSRTLQLPEDVDPDQVTAEFKNGVLTVTLPKKTEIKPRRIEVKGS